MGRRVRRPLLALVALLLAVAIGYAIDAARSHHSRPQPSATSTIVALSSLPAQATATVELIEDGGPFPYPANDGVVFHNDEHRLPREPDGYYHEYTVPTPGAKDRGARRIVTGGGGTYYYYTGDHYEHFVEIEIDG